MRPYIGMVSDSNGDVGEPPIPVLPDEKFIDDFLTLKQGMKVALLVCDDAGSQCARLGIIDECSPRGIWCGFLILHSFFVIVTMTTINTKYREQIAYCKESIVDKLGATINHRILRSGYKVRPMQPLIPSPHNIVKNEDIGGPPIPLQPKVEDIDPTRLDGNSLESEDDHRDQVEGGGRGIKESDKESPDEGNANPDRSHWRGRNCDLLNDDMSFFGRAKIIVCLPDEPFDEENLGDTDASVLFLLEGDLQMTSFRWPLAQVWLEGGRLLSEIVMWCSEHAKSYGDDLGLEGLPKNPYRHVKRRKLSTLVESRLKRKSTDMEVQKVSSLRCCKYRCTQTFSWEDTLAVRHNSTIAHSNFEGRLRTQCKASFTNFLRDKTSSSLSVTTRFVKMLHT